MTAPRKVKSKFVEFVSDGSLIIHGTEGEHLIVDMSHAPAQVSGLKKSLDRYAAMYELQQSKLRDA